MKQWSELFIAGTNQSGGDRLLITDVILNNCCSLHCYDSDKKNSAIHIIGKIWQTNQTYKTVILLVGNTFLYSLGILRFLLCKLPKKLLHSILNCPKKVSVQLTNKISLFSELIIFFEKNINKGKDMKETLQTTAQMR